MLSNCFDNIKIIDIRIKFKTRMDYQRCEISISSISDCRFYKQNEVKEIIDLLKQNQKFHLYC